MNHIIIFEINFEVPNRIPIGSSDQFGEQTRKGSVTVIVTNISWVTIRYLGRSHVLHLIIE